MSTVPPTLINLPPADPMTPSDAPGTPNSTTTSMSELSTVAIKDGHRGHLPHSHNSQAPTSGTLDAERADRISRLAGLERVTTARNPTPISNLTPGAAAPHLGAASGYFDSQGNPILGHMDMETSSVGAASETNSLVGFGEGARTPARHSAIGSPSVAKNTPTASGLSQPLHRDASLTPVSSQAQSEQQDVHMVDRRSLDTGAETAERILRERLGPEGGQGGLETPDASRGPGGDLGKFYFESGK
ncbi:hypothetical protein KCU95_g6924, partial [Aureobasidium melanogenum]